MKHLNTNDGIDPELCSLSYITVNDIAVMTSKLGPVGMFLWYELHLLFGQKFSMMLELPDHDYAPLIVTAW